jgi:hypothetical protein
MPSSLQLDKDGNVVIEPHGKPHYEQPAEFADRAGNDRIEDFVLGAPREVHPELFDGGAA